MGISFNGMANQAQEDEMGTKMVTALDNLANAAVQKNDTFEQLVKSNHALSTTVSSQQTKIKRLLAIVSTLSCGSTDGPKPNNTSSDTADNWNPDGYCFWHGFKVKYVNN